MALFFCMSNVSGGRPQGGSPPLALHGGRRACLELASWHRFTRRWRPATPTTTPAESLGKGAGFRPVAISLALLCFVPDHVGVGYLAADMLGSAGGDRLLFIGMELVPVLSVIRLGSRRSAVRRNRHRRGHPDRRRGKTANRRQPRAARSALALGAHPARRLQRSLYGNLLGVTSYIGFETAATSGGDSTPRASRSR